MSFRRKPNAHDWWLTVVRENTALLTELPPEATANEAAFRDYVTKGVHRDMPLAPSVFDLSTQALDDLWAFINRKAQFDMDATLFDDFNEAFRVRHLSTK
jgi:hypothetical protein